MALIKENIKDKMANGEKFYVYCRFKKDVVKNPSDREYMVKFDGEAIEDCYLKRKNQKEKSAMIDMNTFQICREVVAFANQSKLAEESRFITAEEYEAF